MTKLLTPKNDYVFKKLFTGDPAILTDLINAVLKLSETDKIISVEIKNPDILPDEIEKKFIILDIRAVDNSGFEYDIEMQVRRYEHYPQRTLYYLCRMYGDQLKTGEDYDELHPVIGIHFLDYRQYPDRPEFHYHFQMKDCRYPELTLTDNLSLHVIQLPDFDRRITEQNQDNLMEWMYFFNHAHEKGDTTMKEQFRNPMIRQALDALSTLSMDEKTRELAERREKTLKDEAMFLNEAKRIGRREGIEVGKKETLIKLAEKLIQKGMDINEISEITEMSLDEIAKMSKAIHLK